MHLQFKLVEGRLRRQHIWKAEKATGKAIPTDTVKGDYHGEGIDCLFFFPNETVFTPAHPPSGTGLYYIFSFFPSPINVVLLQV